MHRYKLSDCILAIVVTVYLFWKHEVHSFSFHHKLSYKLTNPTSSCINNKLKLASFAVNLKETNFVDDDVGCSSEGGKFSTPVSMSYVTTSSLSSNPSQREYPTDEVESWSDSLNLIFELLSLPATPTNIVKLCDRIDVAKPNSREFSLCKFRRQSLLVSILKSNRDEYLETVKFLLNRIPRNELPNLQDIPYPSSSYIYQDSKNINNKIEQEGLVADCLLPNITFTESVLDKFLLKIFRDLVRNEIQWKSDTPGIKGLLEEGRHYMLSTEGMITENQHAFVRRTLGALLTPFLPPFYRIFMAGIIPSEERGDPLWLTNGSKYIIDKLNEISFIAENNWAKENLVPGRQLGPWFYAPALTSVVTPPFLSFLVGR